MSSPHSRVSTTGRKIDFKKAVAPVLARASARVLNARFFYAIYTRNLPEVTRLLDRGIDPNFHDSDYGLTPLHLLAERNDYLLGFKLIATKRVNVNMVTNHGNTALHLTCFTNCKKFAVMLMNNGADIEARERFGKTPLQMAVENGFYGLVLKLLQKGANVNVMDYAENTPLSVSILPQSRALFVRTLIKYGADMRLEDQRSLHIFFEAILSCSTPSQIDTILILVENGVDVNLQEKISGRNCLHFVAVTGYLELAVVLVDKGASLDAQDFRRRTPAKAATEHQNYVVADYFRKGYRPPNLLKTLPLVYRWVNKLKARIDEKRVRKEIEEALLKGIGGREK